MINELILIFLIHTTPIGLPAAQQNGIKGQDHDVGRLI
jgi:hypothetical protein